MNPVPEHRRRGIPDQRLAFLSALQQGKVVRVVVKFIDERPET